VIIDTHAHLDYPDFRDDLDDVLKRARDAGVTRVVTIGTGVGSSRRAVALAEKHPNVFAVIGLHPTNVLEEAPGWLDALRELALHPKVAAIGETGMDYHRLPGEILETSPALAALGAEAEQDLTACVADGAYKSAQAEAFRAQLELAAEFGLNVVIHQRDAWDDTLEILEPYQGRVRGVFHCFGNRPDQATEVVSRGHLISFTGIVTFKNAALVRETVATVPAEAFMVETDCPYLAPVPHRGKRCEPAHTRLVAEQVAAIRGLSIQQVADQTTRTAESFFRFHADNR